MGSTQAAYNVAMHPADQIAAPPATSAEPKADAKAAAEAPAKQEPAWEPELDDLASRTVRITPFSSSVQAFKIAPDGKSLVLVRVSPLSGMTGYKIPLGPRGTWLIAPRLPALGRAEGAVCLQRANADSKPPRSGTNPGILCQATSMNRSPSAVWRGLMRERDQYFLRAGGLVRAGRVV